MTMMTVTTTKAMAMVMAKILITTEIKMMGNNDKSITTTMRMMKTKKFESQFQMTTMI